jgi:diguanylate cyclase (GGDEF)-like protein
MYAVVSGTLDVLDPDSDDGSDQELGSHKLINRIKTGDVLGEMGFLRSAPRSATVITTQPVELLKINWKMIKRLQWLYPPTAQKFFFNLMTLICDRLENLTECFSEIKVFDDSTGLYNRENFLKILDSEMKRSQRYQTDLALGIMKFDFDGADPDLNDLAKERILRDIGQSFSKAIRDCDTLGRFDNQAFALLMPHSTTVEAQLLCNRLRRLFEEKCSEGRDMQVRLTLGLADFESETDKHGPDMLARATKLLENAEEV